MERAANPKQYSRIPCEVFPKALVLRFMEHGITSHKCLSGYVVSGGAENCNRALALAEAMIMPTSLHNSFSGEASLRDERRETATKKQLINL
jgi:hypothetical protein